MARNPSHFVSKIQSGSSNGRSVSVASIGRRSGSLMEDLLVVDRTPASAAKNQWTEERPASRQPPQHVSVSGGSGEGIMTKTEAIVTDIYDAWRRRDLDLLA